MGAPSGELPLERAALGDDPGQPRRQLAPLALAGEHGPVAALGRAAGDRAAGADDLAGDRDDLPAGRESRQHPPGDGQVVDDERAPEQVLDDRPVRLVELDELAGDAAHAVVIGVLAPRGAFALAGAPEHREDGFVIAAAPAFAPVRLDTRLRRECEVALGLAPESALDPARAQGGRWRVGADRV